MKGLFRLLAALVLALTLVLGPCAAANALTDAEWAQVRDWYALFTEENRDDLAGLIERDGAYDDVVQVGLYLFVYAELPGNYITKSEARRLGWQGGGLELYAPGKCIGGDRFGNYEGLLPSGDGVAYTECDIDTLGASGRGAKRLVFDGDGRIYYTEDHYDSFVCLYGGEGEDAKD